MAATTTAALRHHAAALAFSIAPPRSHPTPRMPSACAAVRRAAATTAMHGISRKSWRGMPSTVTGYARSPVLRARDVAPAINVRPRAEVDAAEGVAALGRVQRHVEVA